MTTLPDTLVEEVFSAHKSFLWGLCYRLTGSAADADDLVQETFMRMIERPPARTDEPWRPWLVGVALNVGRDLLRRRKRRAYIGPWLPSPIETGEQESSPSCEFSADGQPSPEGRYDLLESVSFAFLLALEALTPRQRAVLLLRDVFDYSVREAAEALEISEVNVKTTHHRARRAMQGYDRARCLPTSTRQKQTRQALERFLTYLAAGDIPAMEELLVADVRAVSDGGGEFLAALKPVVGRDHVIRFYIKIKERRGVGSRFDMCMLNGLPALVIELTDHAPREAARMVLRCDVNMNGQITEWHAVLASDKLTAVRFRVGA